MQKDLNKCMLISTFIAGIVLGITVKFADGLEILSILADIMGRFGIWVWAATLIAIRSKTPLLAAARCPAFFAGMLTAYYGYTVLFLGFFPKSQVILWIDGDMEAKAVSDLEHISEACGYTVRNAGRQMQKYMDLDHSQRVMHCFFIIILTVIGLLVYFNTVFANLLNRRNDFRVMHKIGIRKKEMYWMVLREGLL